MNKILNNQKGSIILGMVAMFIVLTFITSMTLKINTERQLRKQEITNQVEESYKKDSMLELFKNLMEQQITAKEFQKDLENDFIGMQDAIEVQTVLNQKIKENFGEEYKAIVEIEENGVKTKNICEKAEEGYICSSEGQAFKVKIDLIKGKQNESINVIYEGIVLEEKDNKIKANVEELLIQMSK